MSFDSKNQRLSKDYDRFPKIKELLQRNPPGSKVFEWTPSKLASLRDHPKGNRTGSSLLSMKVPKWYRPIANFFLAYVVDGKFTYEFLEDLSFLKCACIHMSISNTEENFRQIVTS